jgi:hypothetical protein
VRSEADTDINQGHGHGSGPAGNPVLETVVPGSAVPAIGDVSNGITSGTSGGVGSNSGNRNR